MRASLVLLITLFVAASASALPRRVFFVDNRAAAGGVGTPDRPFATLAEGARAAHDFDVIFVAETDQPYLGTLTLSRGQMLVGSAYGLDAVRSDLQTELDAPPMPAAQGPGPLIQGSVTLAGQNVVAGVTIATVRVAALSASSATGPISVLGTNIRTSSGAVGIALSSDDFPATFTGGGLTATGGGGVAIYSGRGEVVFDRFNIGGTFTSAIDIRNRAGAVTFRGRGAIDVVDATQPAVTIADCTGRVAIEVPLRVIAHARGVSIASSNVKISGSSSRLETTSAAALEIHDAAVDAAFAGVSATGGDRGIVVDKLRGVLAISGGTIANARVHGIEITQSAGVRLKGITLSEDGSGDRSKCDESIEAATNVRCGAALYLRHVSQSELEDITVTGGKQNGLNANNIEDVTFGGLQIRGAGDERGEAAAVIDEAKGTVKFARCAFEDAAGGGVVVAQQFNAARIVFEQCTFSAAARPVASSHLATFRTSGIGKLDLELRNVEMHDNAASALRAEAAGTSTLNLSVRDSRFERFGREAIVVAARDQAHAAFTLRGTTVLTPGNGDLPAVDVVVAGAAVACADFIGNQVVNGGAVPAVRLSPAVAACR